jgi:hypothetical protein
MTLSIFSDQSELASPRIPMRFPLTDTQKLALYDTVAELSNHFEMQAQRLAAICYDIAHLCMEHGDDPEIIGVIAAYANAAFVGEAAA